MELNRLRPLGRRLVPAFARPALRPLARRLLGDARSPEAPPAPAADPLVLPPDVADPAALRADLAANSAVFGDPREAEAYLADSLKRFRVTMALVPPLPAGARVLELGANPYFLTRLLRRRGLQLTLANWFGESWGGSENRQAIPDPAGGEEVFEFDHFNVERDRFPYPDGAFDLVLMCEILEHLPQDPIHALAEIHRVLAGGGRLLLTTPNAARTENLDRLRAGENVYEQLSGYGVYGRHNREYTLGELDRLMAELGYEVERMLDLDVHTGGEGLDPAPQRRGRGDNLFCLARARGPVRWPYPPWLYASTGALYASRVVRPDLVVGLNDALQSAGLGERELVDGREVRWTGAGPARVLLEPGFEGPGRITVEALAPAGGPQASVILSARSGGGEAVWRVPADGGRLALSAPFPAGAGRNEVTITLHPAASAPAGSQGAGTPARGVGIHAVALVPGS